MRDIITESDRHGLPSEPNASELAGPREGGVARPREIDRGAVGLRHSRFGRSVCLECGDALGPEMSHLGLVAGGDDYTGYAT